MKIQKPIKKIIICLISLSVLVGIGLYIHLHQKSANITQGTPLEPPAGNEATANNTINKGSPLKSTGQVPALSDKPKASADNEAGDLTDQDHDIEKNAIGRLEKRLSDERKKGRESNAVTSMRDSFFEEYHEFFEELNLTTDELTELLDILNLKGVARALIHEKWEGIPSEEEYKQAFKDISEEYDLKVKEILDTDDFKIYQQFDETELERLEIMYFISDSEVGLDEGQKHDLIETMHEEVKNIGLEWINRDYFLQVASYNNDELDERAINYSDRIYDSYINASKNILSPSQAESFAAYVKERRDYIVKMITEM